jgi:hypothetical protein
VLLLGLAQTCRFQDKSLLKFLLSGEKDIDAFKVTKRRRSVAARELESDAERESLRPAGLFPLE